MLQRFSLLFLCLFSASPAWSAWAVQASPLPALAALSAPQTGPCGLCGRSGRALATQHDAPALRQPSALRALPWGIKTLALGPSTVQAKILIRGPQPVIQLGIQAQPVSFDRPYLQAGWPVQWPIRPPPTQNL